MDNAIKVEAKDLQIDHAEGSWSVIWTNPEESSETALLFQTPSITEAYFFIESVLDQYLPVTISRKENEDG